MIRPATMLSIMLFAAFALLLITVLSSPIINGIQLSEFKGVKFGVFGYCTAESCTPVTIGYKIDANSILPTDFTLPNKARITLSKLLLVHPIAAFFTLITLILAIALHFRAPGHSTRFLLILLLTLLPTFLLSLLTFLVDLLLFVPHLSWATWLSLASTIAIAIAGVSSCALRRTLVSRNYNKKRIAENADLTATGAPLGTFSPRNPNPVSPTTAGNAPDKLPEFASFEVDGPNATTTTVPARNSMDGAGRIPVNPRQASPPPQGGFAGQPGTGMYTRTNTTASSLDSRLPPAGPYMNNRPPQMGPGGPLAQQGGPMGMSGAGMVGRNPSNPRLNHQGSQQTLLTQSSGSSGPYGPPRMGPNQGQIPYGRGGPMGPPGGGPMMGPGGPGGPGNGYGRNGPGPMMGPGGPGYNRNGPGPGGPRGPPPQGYNNNGYGPGPGPGQNNGGPYGPGPGPNNGGPYGPGPQRGPPPQQMMNDYPPRRPSPGNMNMGPGPGQRMGPSPNNMGPGPQRMGPSPMGPSPNRSPPSAYDDDLYDNPNNNSNEYIPPRSNWVDNSAPGSQGGSGPPSPGGYGQGRRDFSGNGEVPNALVPGGAEGGLRRQGTGGGGMGGNGGYAR